MFSHMYNHDQYAAELEQARIEEMEYWYAVRRAEDEAARDWEEGMKSINR